MQEEISKGNENIS